MTASVAGGYASAKLKGMLQSREAAESEARQAHRRAGARMARTLGDLKGAVMKVGQMASIGSELLPREFCDVLKTLQASAPPMRSDVVVEQIEEELRRPLADSFAWFDREPLAAASIGQVHRARLGDGREVVVKVQYPGVDRAVDSDLAQLKLAFRAGGLLKLSRQAVRETFEELHDRLHEELDYRHEANNTRLLRDLYRNVEHVRIPGVVDEHSSARVLTLTYEPGDALDGLSIQGYDKRERDRIGEHLLRFVNAGIFDFGVIHADPHPGNFAFRPDGTLIVYDFGCVKRIPPAVLEAYRDTIAHGLAEDYEGVHRDLLKLGLRNPDGPAVEREFYKAWRDTFAEPFVRFPTFDFSRASIEDAVASLIPATLARASSFQPARHLVMLHRTLVGHYHNLKTLCAEIDVLSISREYIDRCEPGPARGTTPWQR